MHPVTKFRPADIDPRAIVRADVAASLAGLSVVVVRAPAGYGKTTFLAQCARDMTGRRTIWIRLDEDEADPAGLWNAIATAAGRAGLRVDGVANPLRASTIVPLIDAFAASDSEWLLALDDVHAVSGEDAIASLDWFLRHIPRNLTVLLATRMPLALPAVERLRARGSGVELTVDVLHFDDEQTRAVLHDMHGLELTTKELVAVGQLTNGWPAAVSLAGAALSRGLPVERLVSNRVEGIGPLVRDGLAGAAGDVDLRRLAVFERFTHDLVVEVLGDDHAWAAAMDAADRTGLIAPLDEDGRWWQMHQLVREHLLKGLARDDPAMLRELHREAITVFEREGDLDALMHHLLGVEDYAAIADVFSGMRENAVIPREAFGLRWLARIPESVTSLDPRLLFWEAVVSAMSGDEVRRDRALARGRVAAASGPVDSFRMWDDVEDFVQAIACYGDVRATLAAGERFLSRNAVDPPDSSLAALHVLSARLVRAALLYVAGRYAEAIVILDDLDGGPAPTPSLRLLAPAYRALCRLELGDPVAAGSDVRRCAEARIAHGLEVGHVHVPADLALARLQTEAGDPAQGLATALAALELVRMDGDTLLFVPQLLIEVARAELALGQPDAASIALTQVEGLTNVMTDAGAIPMRVAALRAAAKLAAASTLVGLSRRELEVLALLPSDLSAADIASELFISPNTARTHITSIRHKLGVTSRGDAVTAARRAGLIA